MKPAPARPRRPHDSQATREALLAAATELFAERGFEGVTVEAIARRAGANKASISYHFGGKGRLYAAIVKRTFEGLAAELRGLRESEAPAEQAVGEFTAVIAGLARREPDLPRMLVREVLSGGQHLPDEILLHFVGVFDTVRGILERGARARRFRRVDPLATHMVLLGSLLFFFATAVFRERRMAPLLARAATRAGRPGLPRRVPTAAEFVAQLRELMVRGLQADDGRARAGR